MISSSTPMPIVVADDKILVIGANGYIEMWLVRKLLEKGHRVRGTVLGLSFRSIEEKAPRF